MFAIVEGLWDLFELEYFFVEVGASVQVCDIKCQMVEMGALAPGGKCQQQTDGQWEQSSHNEGFKESKVRNSAELKNLLP